MAHRWLTLRRFAELYGTLAEIRGMGAGQRLSARHARSAPLVAAFGEWLQARSRRISMKSRLGEKLVYLHRHWGGLQTFLRNGRVAIASHSVENLIRPIALPARLRSSPAMTRADDPGGALTL